MAGGIQLEAADFSHYDIPVLSVENIIRQRPAYISAQESALPRINQHFVQQGRGRRLAVGPGHGHYRGLGKGGKYFYLSKNRNPFFPDGPQGRNVQRNSRTDQDHMGL